MELAESLAISLKCPTITRLAYNASKTELSSWRDVANTIAFTFERVLQLPTAAFWSTVVYDSSIMTAFDESIAALPRRFEFDEYQLIFGWNPSVAMAASLLYYSSLAFFLRIAVFNQKTDAALSQEEYMEIVRGRGILASKRLALSISFFSEHKQLMVEVVRRRSILDNRVLFELKQICMDMAKCTTLLQMGVQRLVGELCACDRAPEVKTAQMIDDWFCTALAFYKEGSALVDIISQATLLKGISKCVEGVPMLVDYVAQMFSTEVIIDTAMLLSDYPVKRLLRLRTQFFEHTVDFYHKVLVIVNDDEKVPMLTSVLDSARFIYLLNEKDSLLDMIKGTQKEFREYVKEALESSCKLQRKNMVEELAKSGLLAGLGDTSRLNSEIRQSIEELSQIFPHFSLQYLHAEALDLSCKTKEVEEVLQLCLRHFGYDVTQTVDAILARDERLPMVLRRVESVDLTLPSNIPRTLPALTFQDDEVVLSALPRYQKTSPHTCSVKSKDQDAKNVFKGLVSLAPQRPATPSNVTANSEEKETISEVMKRLRKAVIHIKLSVCGEGKNYGEQAGVQRERLVPMASSKTYLSMQNFKVSEADKVAIRPTYEKYCYETHEDDIYDDEYDDGYEQKEFTIEPLNAQTSLDDNEDEATDEVDVGREGPAKSRGGPRSVQFGKGSRAPNASTVPESTSRGSYTGGRQRQLKEQHKNAFRQRGADRKMRGAY